MRPAAAHAQGEGRRGASPAMLGSATARRALLGLLAALPLRPGAAAVIPDGYRWKIMREGSQIGTHRVSLAAQGGSRTARSEIEIAIRIAGFTVFRYLHDYAETWDGDRLVAYRSHAERQGRTTDCAVRPDGDGLLAEGGGAAFRLPRDAAPLSWWDPVVLARPVFDTTSARLIEPHPVRSNGAWRTLEAPFSEATYDAAGRWTGYAARGDDGSMVRYEPG